MQFNVACGNCGSTITTRICPNCKHCNVLGEIKHKRKLVIRDEEI